MLLELITQIIKGQRCLDRLLTTEVVRTDVT